MVTSDGRVVNGFIGDQDQQVVVLRTADGQNLVIGRDEIDQMQLLPRAIMPEETLKDLTHQQIRDLFSFLRSS